MIGMTKAARHPANPAPNAKLEKRLLSPLSGFRFGSRVAVTGLGFTVAPVKNKY